MGLSTATLNGTRVTSARINIPAWGCWYAEVTIDGELNLTGAVTLIVADLTMKGTVLSGGASKGRSSFWIVGGAGGWGKTVPKNSYANDVGIKLATVIGDVAAAVGETLATVDPSIRVGPAWTRKAGRASRDLELLAPSAWYVDEAGVTHLGARAAGVLPAGVTHGPVDVARGTVTLASEKIATILPGLVVDGLTAVDVQHELSAKKGLRSTIWGATTASTSRALSAFRAILDQLDPNRAFRGVTEYRVVTLSGKKLNLQAVLVSTGMPDLLRVPAWPGVPGCNVTPALGSRVLVGFVNSDPSRPYVAGFESGVASKGLELATDGLGAGGHGVTLEQVLGLFAQYTAARFVLGDLGATYSPVYSAAPPGSLATLIAMMTVGAVAPSAVGVAPGGLLDALGLPALIATALAAQVITPDPASIGLPTPVFPGLGKGNLKL